MTAALKARLESALGDNISDICPNKFHRNNDNHCAHFVSHMVGLTFTFNCKEFKGGSKPGGNIRVQEIFPNCPLVGKWADRPNTDEALLVFVTKTSNVDLVNKTIRNVPQKHIGIFLDGMIYHYSNSNRKAVKWTPKVFLDTFEEFYDGTQGLYFGTLPGSDLELDIRDDPGTVTNGTGFALRKDDRQWFASTGGGAEFYVGRETSNGDYIGLFQRSSEYYGPVYKAEDHKDRIDHWANLLELTGWGESENHFNVINTYDSAKFTFGFFQMAAHTPKDNLILFFHRLADLPAFPDYFPELTIRNGHLHRIDEDGGLTDLEEVMATGPNGRKQIQLFMNYLNAFRRKHDRQEVLQSARLIHWSNNAAEMRQVQVDLANDILQKKMAVYSDWYGLDGVSDVICALIGDIHHQGRASKKRVRAALAAADPIERLITINENYAGRIAALRHKLPEMQQAGRLGQKVYDAALNEFRDA